MLDSSKPLRPIDVERLLHRQGRRWLCEDVVYDGNLVLPLERFG